MRNGFSNIVFAFICFGAFTAEQPTAAAQSLEVKPAGRELFQTLPKQIVSTTFRLTNNTYDTLELINTVELPDGWELITGEFPFDLAAYQSTTKLLSFLVPETTPAGRYKISYIVKSRKYPAIRDLYTIDVVVLPYTKLEAKLSGTPQYIISREFYLACFSITNKSYKEHGIKVSVVSSNNLPFEMDKETLTLAPWETQTVTVIVKAVPEAVRRLQHHLQLTARIIDEGEPQREATAGSTMEIVPPSDDYYLPGYGSALRRDEFDQEMQSPQAGPIKKKMIPKEARLIYGCEIHSSRPPFLLSQESTGGP